MSEKEKKTETKTSAFVSLVIHKAQDNPGFAARMRRADNPDTAYQSWALLAPFINLEKDNERLPYALIGAALCRAKPEKNGSAGLGAVLASCFAPQGHERERQGDEAPGSARLRRLLACDSQREACQVLRPLLRLMESKATLALDYASLLDDLLFFPTSCQERIKLRWASEFYGVPPREENAMPQEASA